MTANQPSADGLPPRRHRSKVGANTRDLIASLIRDDIVSGALPPGSRVDLDETAARLGTSRTPVREACLALLHEGLVAIAPRTGVTVIGMTRRDVEDNFALMAMLSGAAASWAAERATNEQRDHVRLLAQKVRAAVQSHGDVESANFAFHRAVNYACDSPRLLVLIRQTGRLIPASYFDMVPGQAACALDEHDDIVAAISARDSEGARAVAENHVHRAGVALVRQMFGKADSGGTRDRSA